jgi:hypothetical protein
MKNLITTILVVIFSQFIAAQNISFNNVNSSNVLEMYRENQIGNSRQEIKSIDMTVQIGEGNMIQMIDKTPNYIELVQTGNYNTTLFVNPNNYPTNAQITINGSGNYIDIAGTNSISDGMKININANDMTIFMRNY